MDETTLKMEFWENYMKYRYQILLFSLLVIFSLGGCGRNLNTVDSLPASTAKEDLQAIYLSDNDGYFSAAEIDKLSHAELTANFSEFIRLADQYPDAVLFIDNNAIEKVEITKLKDIMAKNQRLLMVGYDDPDKNIGLEEYWEKPADKKAFQKLPQQGFCQLILVTQEMNYDFPEKWQKKLPLLSRNDSYAFHKTMNEQMTGIVKNKKTYEMISGQKYNCTWESSTPDKE